MTLYMHAFRKNILKLFLGSMVVAFLCFAAFLYFLFTSVPSYDDFPELKDGDLVFQTINSPQTVAIIFATGSLYTHVGVIKIEDDKPYVIEAVGPVRKISLDDWIGQGIANRLSIYRDDNLTEKQRSFVIKAAESYYGRPYDFFFLFDKSRIYCSELVYYAFKDSLGVELGEIETLNELNLNNIATEKLIKSRWQSYPPCVSQNVNEYEDCKKIILEQKLVSPVSIAEDEHFRVIYSNYTW